MTNRIQEDLRYRVSLMQNMPKIFMLTAGACLFTIVLGVLSPYVTWDEMSMLKLFIVALTIAAGVFSLILVVTLATSIYFKITGLPEAEFKKAAGEILRKIADA